MTQTNPAARRQRERSPVRSLGPVADLETHLPEDWWSTLFNALYVKTDGDVVENVENTRREVDRLLAVSGLTPDQAILDLCCGQGRHALELARRGFRRITGVDRSRYLVRLARKRASAEKLNAQFKEGDARQPRLPEDSFDAVAILGNSFGYFADKKDDEKVLQAVARVLRETGQVILDLTDGDWTRQNFEPRSWEWIDAHHFVCRERSLAGDGDRLISREVIVHDELGVIADQFYAERLYGRDQVIGLLETCGFRSAQYLGTMDTYSDRDQDLGMMARRLLFSATAPVRKRKPKARTQALDVTVLLGDPRIPDAVKREGCFSAEDVATVDALKDALSGLSGYRFRYLDNHATMARDLAQATPGLVLNLCDEGFNNDPFKELHVPALLEMLGLKYSGAGPQCLAACYDKALVRALAVQLDIPVPLESFISRDDQGATLPSVFPAILKPNCGDSSQGVTSDAVVTDEKALMSYLARLRSEFPNRAVLVQEFLPGKEYSVGLVGNPRSGLSVLPLLQVDYSGLDPSLPAILGYESKWHPDSPYWTDISYVQASAPDDVQSRMIDYSMRLFERLGCRDYARFDFRADAQGTIKLLEVNPNPGWCWDGKFNLMAGFAGMSYPELLERIIRAAATRQGLQVACEPMLASEAMAV